MRGTLHKTESGWQVWYHAKDDLFYGNTGVRILPILDHGYVNGPGLSDFDEGQEVEFNIFDNREICNCACHRNADITHFVACCNNGYKTDNLGHVNYYAKLVDKATRPLTEDDAWPEYSTRADQLREQGWLEIDKAFSKYWTEYTDGDFLHFTAVEKAQRKIGWLKENYNPPTKKQDNE